MLIVTYRNVFFAITGLFVVVSIAAVLIFGLKLGTDFTGGVLAEARYENSRPSVEELSVSLREAGYSGFAIREAKDNGYIVRAGNISSEMRASLPQTLSINGAYPATMERFSEIGPTIGVELRNKSLIAISLVLLAILLYIALVFRKVSKPVSSWIYGLIALVTLVHDVIVPIGFFAVLGYVFGAQVDTLFVTAVLTILGFSVHDTIVVFDRVRENLRLNHEANRREDFELTAGRSLQQTFVRSVNTSVTVLISLGVLFFVGPESTQDFALTLIVGIIAGTFSSIALATPLLVTVEKWRRKDK
ncbi:MAG: preprotein translocase subunit SecF [Parcubacteria group bacterium Gr01-1014_8]|nr:MAG: preprotein translocase subunit SecF [Parcubacteria group bacterium Gr01-1014_8]